MLFKKSLKLAHAFTLSFIAVILTGTFFLTLPASTVDGEGASFLDALFTITSSVCAVGLSVVDTGTYFTQLGQAVILISIQMGGLGIMILSIFFSASNIKSLRNLVRSVALIALLVELFGALFLFAAWQGEFKTLGMRLWWSIFHAVSAFCNAGFTLSSTSLSRWVDNPWVCSVFMLLITLGGIGFLVLADLARPRVWSIWKPSAIWNRLQIQTKVVLGATLVLNLLGMLLFLFLEYDGVLAPLSTGAKIHTALFQAITARTAGFHTVSFSLISPATLLFLVVWMFVGASPGSTGGGIKTTTATLSLMAFKAMLTGRKNIELFGRRIPPVVINRSLSIILVSAFVVIFFLMLLLGTQSLPFERLLFEAISAFGTVGLSIDTTEKLDSLGRFLIIVLMLVGRVGPLTVALAIGEKIQARNYRYPEGRIAVG